MFPNSSNLGRSPFLPKYQQQSTFTTKLPLNTPPTLLSHQQIIVRPFQFRTTPAVTPVVALQPETYGSVSPGSTSDTLKSFPGRKRQSQQSVPDGAKRQRIHSHDSDRAVVNQAVPLPEKWRGSFPSTSSIRSPVLRARGSPPLIGCVPPLQDTLFPDPTETRLPVPKDRLSQQVLELFQACQQQASDLDRKELCRTELQREIQLIFPQSRLFLVGSSLNGFGTHTSDGDLCLVVKEEPVSNLKHSLMNQKTEARHVLSLVHKLFSTKLCNYIERPQLIRAKVPIVKFRDKKLSTMMLDFYFFFLPNSNVDFDLNVNNMIGIRNTFLLRTYAFIENRVRPLVLVVKMWASFHEINDASRGTLSSYSLVLMVLHYLQSKYFLHECFDPTMQLHLVHQAPRTIPPYISKNGSSLGDLLIGFFKYYATEFE
ncbi:GLD2 polymerase, partial [Certhia familiaris]|nr:GLD2 polymerase [Certhia familiaris]